MTRRLATITCIVLAQLATVATGAQAQNGRLALEARGGFTLPRGDLEARGARSAFAASLDAMYNFHPQFTGYVGVSRDEFDRDFSSQGVQAGLKVIPFREGTVLPWLSGGVVGQKLNTSVRSSDMSLGFEAGGGADFAISQQFTLAPGFRYRSYDAEFGSGTIATSYFTVMLGAHLHLR